MTEVVLQEHFKPCDACGTGLTAGCGPGAILPLLEERLAASCFNVCDGGVPGTTWRRFCFMTV